MIAFLVVAVSLTTVFPLSLLWLVFKNFDDENRQRLFGWLMAGLVAPFLSTCISYYWITDGLAESKPFLPFLAIPGVVLVFLSLCTTFFGYDHVRRAARPDLYGRWD